MLSGSCPGGVAVDPASGPVVTRHCAPMGVFFERNIIRAVTLILPQNPKPPLRVGGVGTESSGIVGMIGNIPTSGTSTPQSPAATAPLKGSLDTLSYIFIKQTNMGAMLRPHRPPCQF